jgi:hypothetical protein
MQDEPTGRRTKEWWWWIVGLALLLLASGAGVFRGFSPDKVDRSEAIRRAAIGGLVGLMLAGLLIGAWAWYRKRTGVAAGALGASLLAALIAFLVAALATIGASTASPTTSSQPGQQDNSSESDGDGEGEGRDSQVDPFGGTLDARTGTVYIDTDGDGFVDTPLVECPSPPPPTIDPDSTATTAPPTTLPPYRVGDTVRVLIDNECDGVIDAIIYVDVRNRVRPGSTPDVTQPDDKSDAASTEDTGSGSSAFGTIFLIVLIVGAAVGVAFAIRALVRTQRAAKPEPLPPPFAPQGPAIDTEAAADSLAESGRILVDDPDPRRAIVAAYGALLEGLEAAGAGRRPFEAPEEHLQRSLRELQITPEALAEVTRLFLVAKFSTHPLGEADRQQARRALGEAERHLRHLIQARSTELP